MQLLEERIRKDGVIKPGNVLKVDGFLNHQMDVELFNEMGKELRRLFPSEKINKILTIEALPVLRPSISRFRWFLPRSHRALILTGSSTLPGSNPLPIRGFMM